MRPDDLVPALAVGAGVAGAIVLLRRSSGHEPNMATGAPTNNGAPVPPVGGVADYVKVYIAQRVKALELFGELDGADHKATPRTTRRYAQTQVIDFWEREVKRLTGGGVLSDASADAVMTAWTRRRDKMYRAMADGVAPLAGLPGPDTQLTTKGASDFWNAVGGLAIDVNIDRATPDYTGGRYLWAAIVESAQELPGRLGEAARTVAATVGRTAFGVAWALLAPLVTNPWLMGGAALALYLKRAELAAAGRRLTHVLL